MNILALENSSAEGSVAWLSEDGGPRVVTFPNDRRHSGAFFAALEKFGDCFATLDLIAVGLGPGSYAGTRIAIGAAIGLQTATGAELAGLPSLCALADVPNEYCVIGDARRQTFFVAHVADHRLAEEISLLPEEGVHLALPAFCSEPLPQFPQAERRFPSALLLAQLARHRLDEVTRPPLEPLYLRAPHITLPRAVAKPAISKS